MKSPRKKKVASLLTLLLAVVACGDPPAQNSTSNVPLLTVSVVPVTRADMVDTVSVFGTVHLRQEARLGSQFDGRLSDFSLLPGNPVHKGQRIGTVIPAAREALLQVLDEMAATDRPALERQIRSIPLFSPIDGVVLEVVHHTGDVVRKGEPIVHLGDLRELDIRGDLPVRYLPVVRKSKEIRVSFVDYPHPPLALPVEAISGQINENNQTAMVRLKLLNPTMEFRPGLLVKLSFVNERRENTLVIPRSALREEEGRYSVFVLNEGTVQKREVTSGILQDSRAEILTGLAENEQVVTEKTYSLEDGLRVRVK